MNHEKAIPTIQAEADRLRVLLQEPGRGGEAYDYLDTLSEEMIEAVGVVDVKRTVRSCDLLLRNVVNASNNAGREALGMMTDAYKEVIDKGVAVTGIDFAELDSAPESQLESLQAALNSGIELLIDHDPADLKTLMDALLWVNRSLLKRDPVQRAKLTKYTDLGYYIDNIAAARLELQPRT